MKKIIFFQHKNIKSVQTHKSTNTYRNYEKGRNLEREIAIPINPVFWKTKTKSNSHTYSEVSVLEASWHETSEP